VKSPTSVLRYTLRYSFIPVSTPHSSGFARLELEAFYFVARFPNFTGALIIDLAKGVPNTISLILNALFMVGRNDSMKFYTHWVNNVHFFARIGAGKPIT
jgi:hypothetical protein